MNARHQCPNCRQGDMNVFFAQTSVPVNSCILLTTAEEARDYPRGDIELGFCAECGFISNIAFEPALAEYSSRYEETQGYSPTFNKFHKQLAERVVQDYALNGKDVIEIGCGKGEFLNLVCELGGNKGIGFDPGYAPGRGDIQTAEGVTFIRDFYSEKYSDYQGDFVCCKMTLEHIPATADFLDQVGYSIDTERGTVAFFQVPDTMRILEDCAYEDIYYEHCSYFCSGSLARLFHEHGLDILKVGTEYDGQYLTIEAQAKAKGERGPLREDQQLEDVKRYVDSFADRYREKVGEWQDLLDSRTEAGQKIVLWGSGSKGVSFLSSLDGNERIEYVVDINPYRQNHYMSGYGQKIVGPEFMKEYRPDLVIVMNRIYMDEIGKELQKHGCRPELVAL